MWCCPRVEIVELVLARTALSVKEAWVGCHLLLAPLIP